MKISSLSSLMVGGWFFGVEGEGKRKRNMLEAKALADLFGTTKERPPKVLCCEKGIEGVTPTGCTVAVVSGFSGGGETPMPVTAMVFAEVGRFRLLEHAAQREARAATAFREAGALAVGYSTGNVRVVEASTAETIASALVHPNPIAGMRAATMSHDPELYSLHEDGTIACSKLRGETLVVVAKWNVGFVARDFCPLPFHTVSPNVMPGDDSDWPVFVVGGRDPFLAALRATPTERQKAATTSQRGGGSLATAVGRTLSSLAGWWSQTPPGGPLPSGDAMGTTTAAAAAAATTTTNNRMETIAALRDTGREIISMTPSPEMNYIAAVDTLGRVLIIDAVASCLVKRMIKGVREAKCAWISDVRSEPTGNELTRVALAIHAPRRHVIEIWRPQQAAEPITRIQVPTEFELVQANGENGEGRPISRGYVFNKDTLELTALTMPDEW